MIPFQKLSNKATNDDLAQFIVREVTKLLKLLVNHTNISYMGQQMKCKSCQKKFDKDNAGTTNGKVACPRCGKNKLKKVLS